MRTVDGKRIFAIIGLMCIFLVIVLLLMLYSFDRDDDQSSINFGETIVFKDIETTKIEQNIEKRHAPDEAVQKSDGARFNRFKRQLAYNPIYYDEQPMVGNLRQKRLAEKLKEIQFKFEQCRNVNPIPMDCEQFHREMVEVHQALDQEIQMSKFGPYYDSQNYAVDEPNYDNFRKFSDLPDPPGNVAMHELNREDKALQSVQEFSPFPKFHEEMDSRLLNSWNVHEPPPPQNAPVFPVQPPPVPFEGTLPSFGSERDNEKISPLKAQNFGKKFEYFTFSFFWCKIFAFFCSVQIQVVKFCGFVIKLIYKIYIQICSPLKLAIYPNRLSVDQ